MTSKERIAVMESKGPWEMRKAGTEGPWIECLEPDWDWHQIDYRVAVLPPNKKKNIVVFYGYKGVGKDTCFELLRDIAAEPVCKVSFADKLRETVWSLFGKKIKERERLFGSIEKKEEPILDWEMPANLGYKEKYWTGRRLLQWFGTDVCRNIYGNIWVESLEEEIAKRRENIICVTDCRFRNEHDFLTHLDDKQYNVVMVHVTRHTKSNEFGTHASEQDIKLFDPDILLDNNGNIDELKAEILQIYKKFLV